MLSQRDHTAPTTKTHTPHDDNHDHDYDCENDYDITHTNPGTDETRREGGNGRERAQTTSDVSFGHPVSFFFFIIRVYFLY